jgi:hypothetical protein
VSSFYVVELPDRDTPLYLSAEGAWVTLARAIKFRTEYGAEEHLDLCPDGTMGYVVHSDDLRSKAAP